MSKYDPEEYQKNKTSYAARQQKYCKNNRDVINERQRKYRKTEPAKYSEARKRRRDKLRVLYNEYMSDKSCSKCGYSDRRALVWHHIDPSSKKAGVYSFISKCSAWDTILKEIEKCECLCHNCHNILHNHTED